jgi:hypothetical protein
VHQKHPFPNVAVSILLFVVLGSSTATITVLGCEQFSRTAVVNIDMIAFTLISLDI